MFIIIYDDQVGNRWNCEYVFENFDDAKNFLIENGFVENNRIFIRENYNWITYQKAIINPVTTIYDGNSGHAYDHIINNLIKKARLLESQLSGLISTVYEHCNEGTAVMELAEKIDENTGYVSYRIESDENS